MDRIDSAENFKLANMEDRTGHCRQVARDTAQAVDPAAMMLSWAARMHWDATTTTDYAYGDGDDWFWNRGRDEIARGFAFVWVTTCVFAKLL